MKARGISLLGAPGAGEEAWAERSRERYGVPHISTGDWLGTAMAQGAVVDDDGMEWFEEALGR